jgi:hypothetical protein
MSSPNQVRLLFLADAAMETRSEKGHLYGPGDQLTLLYIFHATLKQPEREAILAARALIYSKLITKVEMTENLSALPHLRNEWACIQMVGQLSIDDCRRLFPLVRRVGTLEAQQTVADYLTDLKSPEGLEPIASIGSNDRQCHQK